MKMLFAALALTVAMTGSAAALEVRETEPALMRLRTACTRALLQFKNKAAKARVN